jgi:hypothetical protein
MLRTPYYSIQGNNDAAPGSPDIDVFLDLTFTSTTYSDNTWSLDIQGTVRGDKFPANETVMTMGSHYDRSNPQFFLGVSGADGSPFTSLGGKNSRIMQQIDVTFFYDEWNCLECVTDGRQSYSGETWNNQFKHLDPQSSVSTSGATNTTQSYLDDD